jgi:hypothetical protein
MPRLPTLSMLLEDCQFDKLLYLMPNSMYPPDSGASSVYTYWSHPGAAVARPASGSACFR